jgi:sugar transferase (PEP-CTERM/EpsH1 system associated)
MAGALGSRPLTLSYFKSPGLVRRLAEVTEAKKFDVVMACGSAMAQYAERIVGVPRLLDMVDVDSVKWDQYSQHAGWPRSAIWRLEAQRLSEYEALLTTTFDKIVLTTAQEVDFLRSISPDSTASVVRMGMDTGDSWKCRRTEAVVPTLVFVGQMDYFANVDGVVYFTKEVLPLLRAHFPELRFLIVGRSPSRRVARLGNLPGVTVTGEVEDVGPYLVESWVFVAPLRIAQGVQTKVLEAMALGLPTVVSERVMAGLADGGFQDGRDLLVASNGAQLASAIERLIRDAELRTKIGESARSRLDSAYSWNSNMRILEDDLLQIAGWGTSRNGPPKSEPGASRLN